MIYLLALVGSKMFLELLEELVQVLVQGEESRVTGGSLIMFKHTRSSLE